MPPALLDGNLMVNLKDSLANATRHLGYFLFLFCPITYVHAKEERNDGKEKIEHIKIGNFALPERQEPDPLIGFGQIIVDKGDLQAFLYPDFLKGCNKKFKEVIPLLVRYGIKDDLTVLIQLPVAVSFREDHQKSSGAEDLIVLFEWAPYDKDTQTSSNQITLVGDVTFPTGSAYKNPPTGFGSPSFLLGSTAAHKDKDWYYWGAIGGVLTTSHKGTKFGNQALYQLGLCKNISYKTDTYLFNWMLEFDGIYRGRNRILGVTDKNSGGNQITVTPSLWFSTQKIIIQAGISAFICQKLFGKQNKNAYYIALNFGWTFNS